MLLYHDLLPRGVADEAIETGVFSEEHFGEGGGEMDRAKTAELVGYGWVCDEAGNRRRLEVLRQRAQADAIRGDDIEDGTGVADRLLRLPVRSASLLYLAFGGIGGVRETGQRGLGRRQQVGHLAAKQARRRGIGVGVERSDHFIEGADTGQAVSVDEVVIEE